LSGNTEFQVKEKKFVDWKSLNEVLFVRTSGEFDGRGEFVGLILSVR